MHVALSQHDVIDALELVVSGTSVVVVRGTKMAGAAVVGAGVDGAGVGATVRQRPSSELAVDPPAMQRLRLRLHPHTPEHSLAHSTGKHGSLVGFVVGAAEGGTSVVVVALTKDADGATVVDVALAHTPQRNGQIPRMFELTSSWPISPSKHSDDAAAVHIALSAVMLQSITVMAPSIVVGWTSQKFANLPATLNW